MRRYATRALLPPAALIAILALWQLWGTIVDANPPPLVSANLVLGQSSFITNSGYYFPANFGIQNPAGGLGANAFGPYGLAFDRPNNYLYVADAGTNRVLAWRNASSFTNGAPADLVIGQPDFNSITANNGGIGAGTLSSPYGVAVTPIGNLYVADKGNNRVLEYNTPFSTCASFPCVGPAASVVFGQGGGLSTGGSFITSGAALGFEGLSSPTGVAVDGAGNLYVADQGNNRVLEYNTPLANPTMPNVGANRVYGQPDFNSGTAGTSAVLLSAPTGIAISAGALFIADTSNNRVAEVLSPLSDQWASGRPGDRSDRFHGQWV